MNGTAPEDQRRPTLESILLACTQEERRRSDCAWHSMNTAAARHHSVLCGLCKMYRPDELLLLRFASYDAAVASAAQALLAALVPLP